jgi:hypothetical protein
VVGSCSTCRWRVARDLRSGRARALAPWRWTPPSLIRLGIVAALVPIEAMLLAGELGSVREALGVGVTVAQWFILNRALNAQRPQAL